MASASPIPLPPSPIPSHHQPHPSSTYRLQQSIHQQAGLKKTLLSHSKPSRCLRRANLRGLKECLPLSLSSLMARGVNPTPHVDVAVSEVKGWMIEMWKVTRIEGEG